MENHTIKGASLVISELQKLGINLVFGYPGGAILPLYDALYKSNIQHILSKHEQGSIHAAEGYARVLNQPGIVIATSGPGATNIITGLADAMMDSVPLLVITGQVMQALLGHDAFQEVDIIGLSNPVTKYNYQIVSAKEIPEIIRKGYKIANSGRKGPVLIDITKNALTEYISTTELKELENSIKIKSYQVDNAHHESLNKVMLNLSKAKKPLLLIGGGVITAEAKQEVRQFVEKYNIPVVCSIQALSAIDHKNPLFLGMVGMHGSYTANMSVIDTDFLISIGCRFSDRLASVPSEFAKNAKIIHIDIDQSEINKIVQVDIGIISDAKHALKKMLEIEIDKPNFDDWITHCQTQKTQYPLRYRDSDTEIKPQKVVEIISDKTSDDVIVLTDVGQHQMWAAQYFMHRKNTHFITSSGLGTMGFGIPAAIGAKLAAPNKEVILFIGDGGFQMTSQELITLKQYDIKIKIILLNNNALGMVKQWQTMFFEKRYSHSSLEIQPDFMKLAEAYGLDSIKLDKPDNIEQELGLALKSINSLLIEIVVPASEKVYPMIEPGKANNQMIGV